MTGNLIRLAAALLVVVAQPAAAQGAPAEARRLAEMFGAREQVADVSLSPDGNKVALVMSYGTRGAQVAIADLVAGGAPKRILASDGKTERVTQCFWTGADRLACNIVTIAAAPDSLTFSRLVAMDSDGGTGKMLSARQSSQALGFAQDGGAVIDQSGGAPGTVLMTRAFVPESTFRTLIASKARGLGVERVDTRSLKRTVVEPAKDNAVEYISDGRGTVRIMGLGATTPHGYSASTIDYYYRKPGDRAWLRLSTYDMLARSGFNPFAIDPDANAVYGFDVLDGRQALFRIALDGSGKREAVLSHPSVDVDSLITIGRQRRVVGASFATDRRQAEFFDPELVKLRSGLAKALPGQPIVTFLDASGDERKLLLLASSDVHPGTYYVYDKSTRKLETLLPTRPELAAAKLAPVRAVTYPAADGASIPAYLTLPPAGASRGLPGIVLPHGGPGARDEWGFDWLAQFLAARGFAVLQPNFRGSSGYGDAWFQKNGFQSWRTAIGDVNDGGRWLTAQGIARPDRLAVLGWSYGGYAALQSAVLDADLFKAIVAIAPVTDLELLRSEARRYMSGATVDAFIGRGPHVRQGSPALHASRFKAPVLLFHGTRDLNVGVGESRLMANRLRDAGKRVDYVEFDGLEHSLADNAVRAQMLERTDAFLRTSLKLGD